MSRFLKLVLPAAALCAITFAVTASSAGAATPTRWLCRPGIPSNPCTPSLTTTQISPTGATLGTTSPKRDVKPKFDCFYVYPTVSDQKTLSATLRIDPEQRSIALYQAARYSQHCRVFAPMYRQLTTSGILSPDTPQTLRDRAYRDVRDAWRSYLKHDNKGRGVVFVGHSQGAFVLKDMLAKQFDGKKISKRLVSALLIGGNVTVKPGKDVGGQFKKIRACRKSGQIGCVVGYSSFDADPSPDAAFGRGNGELGSSGPSNLQILCTNPASLKGGTGTLKPYLFASPFPGLLGLAINVVPDVATPWATMPGLYQAHCMSKDGASWLQVDHTVGDTRPIFTANIGAGWGLHVGDVNLAWGNLTDVVRAQSKAYLKQR